MIRLPIGPGARGEVVDVDKDRIKAFSGQVFTDMAGAMTAGLGYVGIKTGLFNKMAECLDDPAICTPDIFYKFCTEAKQNCGNN